MKESTFLLNIITVMVLVFGLIFFVDSLRLVEEKRMLLDLKIFLGMIVIVCARIGLYLKIKV